MSTFAPDSERDFELFNEQVRQNNRAVRGQLIAWMAEHLRSAPLIEVES